MKAASGGRTRVVVFRTELAHGGADRVAINLLRAFDRAKIEPILLLMRRRGVLLDDVPVDVPVHSLDVQHLRAAVGALRRKLRWLDPDVFFSLDSGGNIPAVIAHLLNGHRSKLVLSERSILWNAGVTAKRAVQVLLKAGLYASADRVTAVSAGVRDDLVSRLGLPDKKVVVIENPMVTSDMEHLADVPVEDPWFAESPVAVILAVGRLVVAKDYPTLLRAFARVRARRPSRLAILGVGPLHNDLLALAQCLGIADHVRFLGFDKNPYRYMARCAVYVLSSSNEGMPGTLIQAMACGAAVIATNCPAGPAEIIRAPGRDGVLVPVGDDVALAEAIDALLGDPRRRASLGIEARASVSRFHARTATASYENALLHWDAQCLTRTV